MIGLAKYNTGMHKESYSTSCFVYSTVDITQSRTIFFQTSKQNRQARVLFVCASVRAMYMYSNLARS